ncbi:endolysin, protease domain [Arthrobacter phage Mimi]|nr:lysin A, protease domain [Arthrobacter phage Mimi]
MNNHTKITALATTILLSSSLASPANADQPKTQPVSSVTTELPKIKAAAAPLKFEKTAVSTIPAPVQAPTLEQEFVEPAPVPVETPAPVAQVSPEPVAPTTTPTPQTTAPVAAKTATPAPAPVKAPVAPASGKGATIAAAAYAQIGISQDCTALVSNALSAAGINFHGWPNDYASLGTVVSTPAPGDILIYQNAGAGVPHVAIYVGNGMAIHGGWNGGTTVLFSANVGSGYFAVRVA